jgi:hypothetical protein
VFKFNTTEAQEDAITKNIENQGGGGFAGCTIGTASVVQGIGPFRDVEVMRMPSAFSDHLERLRTYE